MPLVSTRSLMDTAYAQGVGLGAFNVLHLESAEALVAAAESVDLPVILQISHNCVNYHGSLNPIAQATLAIAHQSRAQVAVHLDHAEDPNLALAAIDLGFTSVMYDGAKLEYADNVAQTARIVQAAHAAGAYVEAELGEIGGKDGAHAPGVRTDPDEDVQFVAETGVDALAVAVGSSHAMTTRSASTDLDLIGQLRQALSIPLVLHGSSGVPNEIIQAGIHAGLAKINVSTYLDQQFTSA